VCVISDRIIRRSPFPSIHIGTSVLYASFICQQAKVAEAKERREAKQKEASVEKTEKVRT
jgi:hypothetical protein